MSDDNIEEKSWTQQDFGLDRRLIKALSKLGFVRPTLVQAKCIPIALQGKDLLVRARTGSGKTVAFSLPVLQKILSIKNSLSSNSTAMSASIKCLILVPTKELMKQIESQITHLIYYCREIISVGSLSDDNSSVQQFRLQSKPDIVISTPARLVAQLNLNRVDLSTVTTLVIDEADLVLSFGYADDVHSIKSKMPKIFQGLLMSATLSPELDKFKRLVLHNPAVLKLEEPQGLGKILQFYLETTETDKFLTIYVFIKLGLLQGKGLIFVNDVNKCYRLKLFFQQFFISAAVLNAELPLNSRIHILEEYNRGVFDYLIATDASIDRGEEDEDSDGEDEADEARDLDGQGSATREKKTAAKKSKKSSADKGDDGYGVSRGIDFKGVNFVINFDFPSTAAAYTHRIGRTARGNASGTALSFVTKIDPKESSGAGNDYEVLELVRSTQPRLGIVEGDNVLAAINSAERDATEIDDTRMQPAPLQFNTSELESFRYRVEDILRSVTTAAVKELRNAEIKKEILNSEKLKTYFAENPGDLKVLRHDKAILHPIRQHDHLKHVPNYLIPSSMRSVASVKGKRMGKHSKKRKSAPGMTHEKRILKSKMNDPLHSMDVGGQEDNVVAAIDENIQEVQQEVEPAEDISNRVYTNSETIGSGTSGRKSWKMRHKKGEFNPKAKKAGLHRQSGSFIRSKNYK